MSRPPSKRGSKLRERREANLRCLFRAYSRRAKRTGRSFDLTLDRFRELTSSDCFICGAKPKQRYKHDKNAGAPYVYNGIDRMDNSEGYVDGNCAPCCFTCNAAKGTRSLEQFLLYINRAYEHSIKPALAEGTPDEGSDTLD